MLKIIEKFITFVFQLKWLLGFLIHIWTIIIVYSIHGIIGGVIAFILPFISEIYLIYMSWSISGTFFTKYNIVIVGYVILFVILWMLVALLAKTEEKSPS